MRNFLIFIGVCCVIGVLVGGIFYINKTNEEKNEQLRLEKMEEFAKKETIQRKKDKEKLDRKNTEKHNKELEKLTTWQREILKELNSYIDDFNRYKTEKNIKALIALEPKVADLIEGEEGFYGFSKATELGGYHSYFSEHYKYINNFILNEAHQVNPNSDYREQTLLAVILPPVEYCTELNKQAAIDYIKEFPNGKQTYKVHLALFKLYINVYNALWVAESYLTEGRNSIERALSMENLYASDNTVISEFDKKKDITQQKQEAIDNAIKHYNTIKKLTKEEIALIDRYSAIENHSILDTKSTVAEIGKFSPMMRYYGCAD